MRFGSVQRGIGSGDEHPNGCPGWREPAGVPQTPNGSLTLKLRGPRATASQLMVLNSLGHVVHTRTIAAGSASLNLASLVAGVYTFRMKTTEGVLTQHVVRE